jgi:hypothetical protein
MIAMVGLVEKELAAASQTEFFASSAILQQYLESPLPEVRATALRWARTSKQSGRVAIAKALMDNHPMLHGLAKQILLETIGDQMTIKEIMNAVDERDWEAVETTLYRIC